MTLRIALAQFNPCLGDISANITAMQRLCLVAAKFNPDIIVFPEMCISGYPPEDLLLQRHFLDDTDKALERFAQSCTAPLVIAGLPKLLDSPKPYNSLAVIRNRRITDYYHKQILPNYGVFDEKRYFETGTSPLTLNINGITTAFTICEDIWHPDYLTKITPAGPNGSIGLVVNISASPFHAGKMPLRHRILSDCAKHFNCTVAYCNLVGGQDELVFDGRSMAVDPAGKIIAQARAFAEDILVFDLQTQPSQPPRIQPVHAEYTHPDPDAIDTIAEIYDALVLGTGDYVIKNCFQKVLIGLSGGIDSSLVTAIAVDALGSRNVIGVSMPSKFNSTETQTDARIIAQNLGIEFHTIPIEPALRQFDSTLRTVDGWTDSGIAYENLQARIRGCILMSLSNRFGCLVLTTGNKSETAVGYSTLYGDTAGGFAVIKDVPKTTVYRLSEYVNKKHNRPVIPQSVILRIPSAELRPNQADTDSLPEYDLLDRILKGYIEENLSPAQLIRSGLPPQTVSKVIRMVERSEYKRRQSPPGVKITPCAFGKDRRMPITNRYTCHPPD